MCASQQELPLAPPLAPTDNPVYISDLIDTPTGEDATPEGEDVDMELEAEIEHYMIHLAKEQDAIQAAKREEYNRINLSGSTIDVLVGQLCV